MRVQKCRGAVQADIGGDMLIDDLRTTITQQAAFDAVVRVRTSTGEFSHCSVAVASCVDFGIYCSPVNYSV